MVRTTDKSIKINILEKTFQYIVEHGIEAISMRQLSKEIGVSARMLVYHFGSKEQLLSNVLTYTSEKIKSVFEGFSPPNLNPEEELLTIWLFFSDNLVQAEIQLIFEVEVLALRGNPIYRSFAKKNSEYWLQFVISRFPSLSQTVCQLILNTVSGTLLELFLNQNKNQQNESIKAFASMLSK